MISEKEKEALEGVRTDRRILASLTFGCLPILYLVGFAIIRLVDGPTGRAITNCMIIPYMGVIVFYISKVNGFLCPRCGEYFFHTYPRTFPIRFGRFDRSSFNGYFTVRAMRCEHCGLPRDPEKAANWVEPPVFPDGSDGETDVTQ